MKKGNLLYDKKCVSLQFLMKRFIIELEQEDDGRWIAEIPTLPGALCYGVSKENAERNVEALALRILADRVESEEKPLEFTHAFFALA